MEITYKDLERVNAESHTTSIKDKDYVEVNERIKAFRKLYPTGAIMPEIIEDNNQRCVIKATVGYCENGEFRVLGIGHAYEKEGNGFINKTSYIENCETSAVGRALGMAGFGINTSVASAEEEQNAMVQQDQQSKQSKKEKEQKQTSDEQLSKEKICELHLQLLRNKIQENAVSESKICKKWNLAKLEDMNEETFLNMYEDKKNWEWVVKNCSED